MSTLKHKGKGPQAMTANGLHTGPVVYLTAEYDWSTAFSDALLSEDAGVITAMRAAADKAEAANIVVGAYFIDVDPKTKQPARYRERFRANGPSFDPGVPTHDALARKDGPQIIGGA